MKSINSDPRKTFHFREIITNDNSNNCVNLLHETSTLDYLPTSDTSIYPQSLDISRAKDVNNKQRLSSQPNSAISMRGYSINNRLIERSKSYVIAHHTLDNKVQSLKNALEEKLYDFQRVQGDFEKTSDQNDKLFMYYKNALKELQYQVRGLEFSSQQVQLDLNKRDSLLEETLQSVFNKENEIKELKFELEQLNQKIEKANQMLIETEDIVQCLRTEDAQKNEETRLLNNRIKNLQMQLQKNGIKTRDTLENKNAMMDWLQTSLSEAEKRLKDMAENCQSSMEEKDFIIDQLQDSLATTEKKIKELEKRTKNLESEAKHLKSLISTVEEQLQISVNSQEKMTLEKDQIIKQLHDTLAQAENEVKDTANNYCRLSESKDIVNHQLKETLIKLEKACKELMEERKIFIQENDNFLKYLCASDKTIQELLQERQKLLLENGKLAACLDNRDKHIQELENHIAIAEEEQKSLLLKKIEALLCEKDQTIEALTEVHELSHKFFDSTIQKMCLNRYSSKEDQMILNEQLSKKCLLAASHDNTGQSQIQKYSNNWSHKSNPDRSFGDGNNGSQGLNSCPDSVNKTNNTNNVKSASQMCKCFKKVKVKQDQSLNRHSQTCSANDNTRSIKRFDRHNRQLPFSGASETSISPPFSWSNDSEISDEFIKKRLSNILSTLG